MYVNICSLGYSKFAEDIEIMLGSKPSIFFKISWVVLTPLILLVSIFFPNPCIFCNVFTLLRWPHFQKPLPLSYGRSNCGLLYN